jgi:hypothetical protein
MTKVYCSILKTVVFKNFSQTGPLLGNPHTMAWDACVWFWSVQTEWPAPSLVPTPLSMHLMRAHLGLVRLFLSHVDWMRLEKFMKDFDLFGIETHPIPPNPHGLRAKRTCPYMGGSCIG